MIIICLPTHSPSSQAVLTSSLTQSELSLHSTQRLLPASHIGLSSSSAHDVTVPHLHTSPWHVSPTTLHFEVPSSTVSHEHSFMSALHVGALHSTQDSPLHVSRVPHLHTPPRHISPFMAHIIEAQGSSQHKWSRKQTLSEQIFNIMTCILRNMVYFITYNWWFRSYCHWSSSSWTCSKIKGGNHDISLRKTNLINE